MTIDLANPDDGAYFEPGPSALLLDHPTLGPVMISPMQDDELALVLSSWMHSSDWRRREMVAVVEDKVLGEVLVARDDGGLALGWLALWGGRVGHGYVKQSYRSLGLARLLWEAAGRPSECADNVTKRVRAVMARLNGGK